MKKETVAISWVKGGVYGRFKTRRQSRLHENCGRKVHTKRLLSAKQSFREQPFYIN